MDIKQADAFVTALKALTWFLAMGMLVTGVTAIMILCALANITAIITGIAGGLWAMFCCYGALMVDSRIEQIKCALSSGSGS